MSWYDEARYFTRGRYDRDHYEPRTEAFAGPGLSSPGLLGGAGFVRWRERPTGFTTPEGYGRRPYGYDYDYGRRFRRRPRYDLGWRGGRGRR